MKGLIARFQLAGGSRAENSIASGGIGDGARSAKKCRPCLYAGTVRECGTQAGMVGILMIATSRAEPAMARLWTLSVPDQVL
jgi:hypothetical protein